MEVVMRWEVLVLVLVLAAACTPNDVDCSRVKTFAKVTALSSSCASCHASTRTGDARQGAPPTINFDSYAGAVASADLALVALEQGRMPPDAGPAIDDEERNDLVTWLQCGQPK
jgi:uncharacterized membrane protein